MTDGDTWKDKIREFDWFGHSVTLNFNREGDTHNTLAGGFASIVFRVGMTVYIFMNCAKLLFTSDDNILFSKLNDSSVETNPVTYKGMQLAFFWVLRTSMGFEDTFVLNDDIKPYVKVEFI